MHFNPLPQVIRRIRDQHELIQKQLGQKMGVRQSTISAWENGKTRPNLRTEQKIFKSLETTDKEIGAVLYEIVSSRFGYDKSGSGAPAPRPRRMAAIEDLLEELADRLPSETLRSYERDLLTIKAFEGNLRQMVFALEDKLDKEAEKAGKKIDSPD